MTDKETAQKLRLHGPPRASIWRHYKGGVYEIVTTATGNYFPVKKSDLRDDIRRALAHGVGNCGMRPEEDGQPFRFLPPGATWAARPEKGETT